MEREAGSAPGASPKDSTREGNGSIDALERVIIAEELASLIRHELRNNLSSIRNAAFYLKRRAQTTHLWDADQRVPQFFTLIEELVVGSTRVLDERLKLKHAGARSVARASGRECVERAAACARVPGSVSIDIDAGAGDIDIDVVEAAVAIRCLLENAAEATPGGGRVKVSAEKVSRQFIISISDEGAGVPLANRDIIFDAFHTTKEGHVGLGLNIARRVARRYGGDVVVEPAAAGTRVTISLSGRPFGAERR